MYSCRSHVKKEASSFVFFSQTEIGAKGAEIINQLTTTKQHSINHQISKLRTTSFEVCRLQKSSFRVANFTSGASILARGTVPAGVSIPQVQYEYEHSGDHI